MSRRDFTPAEFARRRSALAQVLQYDGLSGLIAIHPRSIHWLTGCRAKSYQGFQCLFVPANGDLPVYLTRKSERIEVEAEAEAQDIVLWGDDAHPDPIARFAQIASSLGMAGQTVALETPDFFLGVRLWRQMQAACGAFADGNGIVDQLRMIKSDAEQVYIRRAAQIADASIDVLSAALHDGCSELQLAAQIYSTILQCGGEVPASPINLSAGSRAIFCHGAPSQRQMTAGEHGNAEYGVPYRGYTVSIGRQFCIGQPSTALSDAHAVIGEALDAAIATCADGVPACDVFEAADAVLRSAGMSNCRAHTMGYGMATAFPPATGEGFHLTQDNTRPLQRGMQISVCPNIFDADQQLGIRLVDNILVHDCGAAILTQASRVIIEGKLI